MQILLISVLILIVLAIIIYKINNKFGKKEQQIYVGLLSLLFISYIVFESTKEKALPTLFKEQYLKKNNIEILKLSSKLLNNKVLSSNKHFVYEFTYIIKKEEKEYVCTANKVDITKIQDEFIIKQYKEKCEIK